MKNQSNMLILVTFFLLAAMPLSVHALEPFPSAKPVIFDFDAAALHAQARDQLAAVADMMQRKPMLLVKIIGHTDERGSAEYSMALGERRAKVVMNYLKSLGIASERLKVESHGKEQPLDPRHNEEAWARNRRVEFEFFIVENSTGQEEQKKQLR